MQYCGRQFSTSEIDLIRNIITANPNISRYRLSLMACEQINWRRLDGKLKDMSFRVAMLKMEADGLICLPLQKRSKIGPRISSPVIEEAIKPPETIPKMENLFDLSVKIVKRGYSSQLWNAYISQYHYLGYQPLPGAQLRYIIYDKERVVALLGFGAGAWKVKPRDDYIGWSKEQRQRNLHLVVNNARFLILPWINRRNLASRVLSIISRRLADDWEKNYGYRPVLLETFVEDARFLGTCYKAANWRCLGKTQGRGKLDQTHQYSVPIKSIWVYPLNSNARQYLYK